jgi:hypothetical protein
VVWLQGGQAELALHLPQPGNWEVLPLHFKSVLLLFQPLGCCDGLGFVFVGTQPLSFLPPTRKMTVPNPCNPPAPLPCPPPESRLPSSIFLAYLSLRSLTTLDLEQETHLWTQRFSGSYPMSPASWHPAPASSGLAPDQLQMDPGSAPGSLRAQVDASPVWLL